jgi:hypothetical protein
MDSSKLSEALIELNTNASKLSQDHWEFIEALIELSENNPIREYLFIEGFKHGYKHGYEDGIKLRDTPRENPLRGVDSCDGVSPSCIVLE